MHGSPPLRSWAQSRAVRLMAVWSPQSWRQTARSRTSPRSVTLGACACGFLRLLLPLPLPSSSSSFPFEHVPYLLPLLRCVGARACRLDAALTLLKAAVHAPPLDHGSSGPSGEGLRKNDGPFLSGFPMFVPSLSWQNHYFYIYMAQKDRFFLPINQPTCSFRLLCVSHYR